MKLYIISGDTRIEQDKVFFNFFNNGKNEIYYCNLNKKKEILRNNYKNINYLSFENYKKEIFINKGSNIIFYEYYGNLDNFNFSGYKLSIFGFFVFNDSMIKFNGLKKVNIFSFLKQNKAKIKIRKLFGNIDYNFISNINYPSAIDYKLFKNKQNIFKYDFFIPLGGKNDYSYLHKIISHYDNYIFYISPINHPSINKKEFKECLSKIKGYKNVFFGKLSHSQIFAYNLFISKIVLLPLKEHIFDLTRNADAISLGKVILTNRVECTVHLDGLLFFEGFEDCIEKIDDIFEKELYNSNNYKNSIINLYNLNFSIEKLLNDLIKFLNVKQN